ncbi:MAG: DUF6036 family nucleotidyltransferase [Betaproteobacteria bacterium]|nr:DUF6036 family nucleotidyltransferase [Betaproteobacteria bacterium]
MKASGTPVFQTQTPLAQAFIRLVQRVDRFLVGSSAKAPIAMYLAGGMATHLYTGARGTTDIDAEYSRRLLLPLDILEQEGTELYFDQNFSTTYALMHEDYQANALLFDAGTKLLSVRVLTPVDLVLSKLARFSHKDQFDIDALIRAGLVTAEEIEKHADESLCGYVGDTRSLQITIQRVVSEARKLEASENHRQG